MQPLRTMILQALRYPAFLTSDDLLGVLVGRAALEHKIDYGPRPRSQLATVVDEKRAVRFSMLLSGLVAEKRVERVFDKELGVHRYRLMPRYRLRQVIDTWHVDRLHPHIADHWNVIVSATEAEARVCLAALEVMS